jgi:hypothetical protein
VALTDDCLDPGLHCRCFLVKEGLQLALSFPAALIDAFSSRRVRRVCSAYESTGSKSMSLLRPFCQTATASGRKLSHSTLSTGCLGGITWCGRSQSSVLPCGVGGWLQVDALVDILPMAAVYHIGEFV